MDKPSSGKSTSVDLSVISAGKTPPSNDPDERFREEKRELELESSRTQIEGEKSDITAKRQYAKGTFLLVVSWIFLVFVILLFQGFAVRGFKLSDSVLLAAIGSTTANVIGMLVIVLKNIFPSKEKDK
jgi:hypothetical protein